MKMLVMLTTCCLLTCGLAYGEEDLWSQYRDAMVGSWVSTGVIPEGMEGAVVKAGDEFRMTSTFWTALDGKTLVGRQSFRIIGNNNYVAQSHYVAGWNAAKKRIDVRVYWSDGDIDECTFTKKDGTAFVGEYIFTGGKGKESKRDARFDIVDQDTLAWGETEEVSTWKRVKSSGPKTDLDFVDYYSYFLGDWKVKSTDATDDTVGVFRVALGPSGKCHLTRFEFGDLNGDGVWGRDPVNGRWTGTGFNADGSFWQSVFAAPKRDAIKAGMSFNIRRTQKLEDGSKANDTSSLSIIDEDTWESVSTLNSFRMVRMGATALSPYYEKYKVLDMWVGDWTAATKLDDVEFVGDFSCRWTPGRACLAWTWRAPKIAGSPISEHGYGIFGWDPARNQIVELGFGSNGLAYTTYYDVKGNALHGTRHTVLPDGEKVTETMIFTSHADRIAIKNIERRDADGNVIPFVFPEESSFERVEQD